MDPGKEQRKERSVPHGMPERRLSRAAAKNPLFRFISKNVPLPFITSEFFYGAWMSCIAVNLISGFAVIGPETLIYVISAAFMVNIIWGTIDGTTYTAGMHMASSEEDRAIFRLLNDGNDADAKEKLIGYLEDSGPTRHLGPEDTEKVAMMILASDPDVGPKKKYKFGREDYNVILSFLMIDLLIAALTVLPFVVIQELPTAALLSRMVTVSVFACVAYVTAKCLNRNRLFWVAAMSALGVFISEATFIYS